MNNMSQPLKDALQKWHFDSWDYYDSLSAKHRETLSMWFSGMLSRRPAGRVTFGPGFVLFEKKIMAFYLLQLHQIIMNAPPVPVDCQVARGFRQETPLEAGDTISFQRPVSTTFELTVAKSFTYRGMCCLITIQLKNGDNALFLGPPHWPGGKVHPSCQKNNSFDYEYEVLLAGLKVHVDGTELMSAQPVKVCSQVDCEMRICLLPLKNEGDSVVIWDADEYQQEWVCQSPSIVTIKNNIPQDVEAMLNGLDPGMGQPAPKPILLLSPETQVLQVNTSTSAPPNASAPQIVNVTPVTAAQSSAETQITTLAQLEPGLQRQADASGKIDNLTNTTIQVIVPPGVVSPTSASPVAVISNLVATSSATLDLSHLEDAPKPSPSEPPEGDSASENATMVQKRKLMVNKLALLVTLIVTGFLCLISIILLIVMKKLASSSHFNSLKIALISIAMLAGMMIITTVVLTILHIARV